MYPLRGEILEMGIRDGLSNRPRAALSPDRGAKPFAGLRRAEAGRAADLRTADRPVISLAPLDLTLIALYVVVTVVVGMGVHRFRGGGAEAYLVAGRSVSLSAFVARWWPRGTGGILGVGEYPYTSGLYTLARAGHPILYLRHHLCSLPGRRVRSASLYTIPDRLAQHYGRGPAILGSAFVFVLVSPAPYVLMLGVLLQIVTAWPLWVCVLAGTVFSTFYVANGGLATDIA